MPLHLYYYIYMHILTSFSFPGKGDAAAFIERDGVVALLWHDNRVCTLLSTNAQPQQQDIVQRREHDSRRVDVPCPTAIALCNANNGVITNCGSTTMSV